MHGSCVGTKQDCYRKDSGLCFPYLATLSGWPFGFLPIKGSFNSVFIISQASQVGTFDAPLGAQHANSFLLQIPASLASEFSGATGGCWVPVGQEVPGNQYPHEQPQTSDRWELVTKSSSPQVCSTPPPGYAQQKRTALPTAVTLSWMHPLLLPSPAGSLPLPCQCCLRSPSK